MCNFSISNPKFKTSLRHFSQSAFLRELDLNERSRGLASKLLNLGLLTKQTQLYMDTRDVGDRQIMAAAKAGVSPRTGQCIESGRHQS
jgi:hypothetical protein